MHERWSSRVASLEGVGTLLLYKYDGKLFRRSTRQACKRQVLDGQFADDAVLFAGTRTGAEQALMLYQEVAGAFGLKVNLQKTKLMAVGPGIEDGERAPITTGNDVVECVEDFTYLGSSVTPNARIDAEVDRRLASASKAFGALRHAIFALVLLLSDMSIRPVCCQCYCMGQSAGCLYEGTSKGLTPSITVASAPY